VTSITPSNVNDWADFWRYEIGVNVIPADTKNKRTWIHWSEYQNKPIPIDRHEHWKRNDKFKDGMAIIVGKIWHNPTKEGLYLAFIDLDNQKAIEEFCKMNGRGEEKITSLQKISGGMIVEQHRDDPSKAHIYCYTKAPLPRKSSDKVNDLANKLDSNEIPAFEVKGLGEHGIAYCTPSPHKNGNNYEIIGTLEPAVFNGDLVQHIDSILKSTIFHILVTATAMESRHLLSKIYSKRMQRSMKAIIDMRPC
jgi:hypothetical protein